MKQSQRVVGGVGWLVGRPMTLTAPRTESRDGQVKPRLTATEIETLKKSFAENGYVVLKNVVSREGPAQLAAKMQAEFDSQKRSGRLFNPRSRASADPQPPAGPCAGGPRAGHQFAP